MTTGNMLPPGYVRGCDGKVYPYRALPAATRTQIVGRVHYLSHDLHLSVRQIVARLAEGGFHASVGTVHGWLRTWRCDHCSGGAMRTPEHLANLEGSANSAKGAESVSPLSSPPSALPSANPRLA